MPESKGSVEAPAGGARYARSRYWILPSIQGRFIGWLVAVSAIVATTVSLALLIVVWLPVSRRLTLSNPGVQTDALAGNVMWSVLLTTAVLIIVFGLVALAAGLLVSHKVAGPIYRIGMVAGQVGDGQMNKRIELRRGDYIRELADKLNVMLDQVETRFRAQQQALEAAQQNLAQIEAAVSAGQATPQEMERRIQEALRALQKGRLDSSGGAPA